jgi:xanthine/CO dehydrogenase XdhC/CoxF family maturation factor
VMAAVVVLLTVSVAVVGRGRALVAGSHRRGLSCYCAQPGQPTASSSSPDVAVRVDDAGLAQAGNWQAVPPPCPDRGLPTFPTATLCILTHGKTLDRAICSGNLGDR